MHTTEHKNQNLPILGIWDGHDAGAAIILENSILFAANEERFSRRKLEVGFPHLSIKAALKYTGYSPEDISYVSISTSDFAKTLTRLLPQLKEEYYLIRRRKKPPSIFNKIKKFAKYKLTEIPSFYITKKLSSMVIARELSPYGFPASKLIFVEHHAAHAASAAFCSGLNQCLVLTLDGIGDALSGSIWDFKNSKLTCISNIAGRHSLGIFFEHVTNLLNMRELEDEGKVMALANFAYPIPEHDNPLLSFFKVDGLNINCIYSSTRLYKELSKVLWRFPSEQFAYLAQQALSNTTIKLVKNAIKITGHNTIAYAGGVASNIKVNQLIRELPEVSSLFVFPHMGDGGLGFGSCAFVNYSKNNISSYKLENVFLGPEFSSSEFESTISKYPNLSYEKRQDYIHYAARLISSGEIIMWFQGRMEFGPRSLGARSILALPNSRNIKDELNIKLKKRVWYQPFCPSMLEEDAREILLGYTGEKEKFMTSAYYVKDTERENMAGVINVDGTCRPQILESTEKHPFVELLKAIKKYTGKGVLLNTSFNIHGEPIVCTPQDALKGFSETEINYIVMNDFIVRKL
jgi:carbamoyltransferase